MEETLIQGIAAGEDERPAETDEHLGLVRLDGSADVNAELEEIGLSSKSGWYASVVLYGVGGLVTLAAGLLWPEVVPIGVTQLAGVAICLAVLSAIGAKFLTNADWATHMRLLFGIAIFVAGMFVAGDLRVAFVMLVLFVLITPTFMYGTRFALPYVTVATPLIFVAVAMTPGAGSTAHAIVSSAVMLALTGSFMAVEHRTRSFARANRRLAYTDALTGIANMRHLRELLAHGLGAPDLTSRPFALFAIDLDNFKAVNDNYGHTTGDKVLRAVAQALAAEAGADDLVARRGGDEFSVMVTDSAGADLERLAGRFAAAIERARRATCPEVTPTGCVAWVIARPDDSISSVLQRADDALHESKTAARALAAERREGGGSPWIDEDVVAHDAAIRSVSAAVSRAYSAPPRRTLRERLGRVQKGVRRFVGELDLIWSFVAVTFLPIGSFMLALTLAGLLSPLPLVTGVLLSGLMLALGGAALWAARRDASKAWIFWVQLAGIAVLSLLVAAAGPTGDALIDTYVVLALFGFYYLPTREAVVSLVTCCVLFIGFAVIGDYPFAAVRSAVTVSVILAAAAIVIKVRSVTLGFVRQNRELSETDDLTGLPNLRALRSRVGSAIERLGDGDGAGARGPILMTVDLDQFKLVNDRYSHTVGDQMIEAVSRAISESVRIDEMVARRGGDEFFVLFADSTPERVEAAVPRIAAAVAHTRERICPDLTSSATIGWIQWRDGQSVEQFMAAADGVMHENKRATHDRGYMTPEHV